MYRFITSILLLISLVFLVQAEDIKSSKREFRGAWLHVIGQSQWQNKNVAQQKKYIEEQLDLLSEAGCNAVIFQIRPTADALYISELEPWSTWLTGKRGKAPEPLWDPLEYAITEAHKRGMELHAWLNPYRVTSNSKETLPSSHDVNKEPHRFVKFNGQIFFDPAYPENRDHICKVVADIVNRYDVDAIHIDDYFYPYPANGKKFEADDASYAKFGNGMERNAWRRHNVDLLIKKLNETIKDCKPWVRFGVSPFGIWRNKSSDPRGSNSNGLQNYDDLYADVLLWDENGWIDYLVPQLYWTLDMKAAPSRHLAEWWNDNVKNAQLYIGQDVQRTMTNADKDTGDSNELATKVNLSRKLKNVKGNVWWHGYWVTDNLNGVADSLALRHQANLAIPPAFGDTHKKPQQVKGLKVISEGSRMFLTWDNAKDHDIDKETDVVKYVVYQFFPGEKIDIEDGETIIAITPLNAVLIEDASEGPGAIGSTFVVTALDRMNRESDPSQLTLK